MDRMVEYLLSIIFNYFWYLIQLHTCHLNSSEDGLTQQHLLLCRGDISTLHHAFFPFMEELETWTF